MNAAEVLAGIDSNNCVFIHLSHKYLLSIYYEPRLHAKTWGFYSAQNTLSVFKDAVSSAAASKWWHIILTLVLIIPTVVSKGEKSVNLHCKWLRQATEASEVEFK